MSLLVAGSVALDSLMGGRFVEELGGSALYAALAAAPIYPVRLHAPVGGDAAPVVRRLLANRPAIDGTGLVELDAPTYRWFATAERDRNVHLESRDAIYDSWRPELPAAYRGWAFVGSMRPDRQLDCVRALAGCGLLAADAMRSYVEAAPAEVADILGLVDWFFCNVEELAALGGGPPGEFRRRWGLTGLVVKDGARGVTAFVERGQVHAAAVAGPVVDTTGAGDALAGGMLAHWLRLGGAPGALEAALRRGAERAAVAISEVGLRALAGEP